MIPSNKLRRRQSLRFQLTALLDLLLIIVFAQYLEFQVFRQQESRITEEQVDEVRQSIVALSQSLEQSEQVRRSLESRISELQQQRQLADSQSEESKKRLQDLGELIRRLFDQIEFEPEDSDEPPPQSVAEAELLTKRISSLSDTDLIRFLVGYEELKKRAEIWVIHVTGTGMIDVSIGPSDQIDGFRIEGLTQAERKESFVDQARLRLLQIPQPKAMAVLLVSYSPRAIAGDYQPVIDGMPELAEKLESDYNKETKFEFSVLGPLDDPQP